MQGKWKTNWNQPLNSKPGRARPISSRPPVPVTVRETFLQWTELMRSGDEASAGRLAESLATAGYETQIVVTLSARPSFILRRQDGSS